MIDRARRMAVIPTVVVVLLVYEAFPRLDAESVFRCYTDNGVAQRCMPEFVNAAYGKVVDANDTCGTPPSIYCLQTGVTGTSKICEYCDASQPELAHPAAYITDIKDDLNRTWWQSRTLLDNRNPVTLTLNLNKSFDLTYIRIRFHTSRPESFAIYKKNYTTSDWEPYQYYSRNCLKTYGIPPKKELDVGTEAVALCSEDFSEISPLSGGNVVFLTLDHRPSKHVFDESESLQGWVTVSAIKIVLHRMNTFGDQVFGDPTVLRSYYYAITDLAIGGRCKCNGHASECIEQTQEDGSARLVCRCEHNTEGDDCERCQPLYNQVRWGIATEADPRACVKCECNELADRCIFDQLLFNLYGKGGRCVGCRNNTDGINCERCKVYHYRRTPEEACRPCDCHPEGAMMGSCNSDGLCICRPGVVGDKCDQCAVGFYNLSTTGCSKCDCDSAGSLGKSCDDTGQCICKKHVTGLQCNKCMPGYFDLDPENPNGCKACFCSGHSDLCEALPGMVHQPITSSRVDLEDGWRLVNKKGQNASDVQIIPRGSQTMISLRGEETYLVLPPIFYGNRLSSYMKNLSFIFGISRVDGVQASDQDIVFEGAGLKASYPITAYGNPMPAARYQRYQFRLQEPSDMPVFDFHKLLSNLTSIKIRLSYQPSAHVSIDKVVMDAAKLDPNSAGRQVTWMEKCICPPGYQGSSCNECASGHFREPTTQGTMFECVACDCNGHADNCDVDTGACYCLHNTTGSHCERCAPGFYGDATLGTPNDCKQCSCIFSETCGMVDGEVRCLDCPEGHYGPRCEYCMDNYFGDPQGLLGPPSRCQPCACSNNIISNSIGNCDPLTGQCLRCEFNTRNGPLMKCDLCEVGYFGNATAEPRAQCNPCNCNPHGAVKSSAAGSQNTMSCDSLGQCSCLPHVTGRQCNICEDGYWNVGSGVGCEPCSCDPRGSTNTSCDLVTGHCYCKPGIVGDNCNQCSGGYYKFSENGCQDCRCHPDGAVDQNCTEGVCTCKPGVIGIKCDQCPRSQFNVSAGCIACPPCYAEIERKVNRLQHSLEMMLTLPAPLIEQTSEGPGTGEKLDDLTQKADLNSLYDDQLQHSLNTLVDRIGDLTLKYQNSTPVEMDYVKLAYNLTEDLRKALRTLRDKLITVNKLDNASKTAARQLGMGPSLTESGRHTEGIQGLIEQMCNTSDSLSKMFRELVDTLEQLRALSRVRSKQEADRQALTNVSSTQAVVDSLVTQVSQLGRDLLELSRKVQVTIGQSEDLHRVLSQMEADIDLEPTLEHAAAANRIASDLLEETSRISKIVPDSISTSLLDLNRTLDRLNVSQQLERDLNEEVAWFKSMLAEATDLGQQTRANVTFIENVSQTLEDIRGKEVDAARLLVEVHKSLTEADANIAVFFMAREDVNRSLEETQSKSDSANLSLSNLNQRLSEISDAVQRGEIELSDQQQKIDTTWEKVRQANETVAQLHENGTRDAQLIRQSGKNAEEAKSNAELVDAEVKRWVQAVNRLAIDVGTLPAINAVGLDIAYSELGDMGDFLIQLQKSMDQLQVTLRSQSAALLQHDSLISSYTEEVTRLEKLYDRMTKDCWKGATSVETR